VTTLGVTSSVEEARSRIEAAIVGKTVLTEFRDAVAERGDAPALHWRTAGGWQALTWREYRDVVRRAAYGLTRVCSRSQHLPAPAGQSVLPSNELLDAGYNFITTCRIQPY